MLRNQSFFTTAVKGVIKQGKRSISRAGNCKYRGPNGLKCAIGHVMPDEVYDPNWDNRGGKRIDQLMKTGKLPMFDGVNLELMQDLQHAHDHCTSGGSFVADFTRKAQQIAERYNLKMPVLS